MQAVIDSVGRVVLPTVFRAHRFRTPVSADHAVGIDTSVAVPYVVEAHPDHRWLREWGRGRDLRLSGQASMETYAVLTRLPGDARVSGTDAALLIDDNFGPPLLLPAGLARRAHRELARHGVSGGATYDGLVALAGRELGVALATRDARARSTYDAVDVTVELLTAAS